MDVLYSVLCTYDGQFLKNIEKQTYEICKRACENNGHSLKYVKEQTPELCLIACKNWGSALRYSDYQTEEICIAAVENSAFALKYVKVQTEKIIIISCLYHGFSLQYVKGFPHTPELCEIAIGQYKDAVAYFNWEDLKYHYKYIMRYAEYCPEMIKESERIFSNLGKGSINFGFVGGVDIKVFFITHY